MTYQSQTQKPKYKLKTIVKFAEKCILYNDCKGCGYKKFDHCQIMLCEAMLYYLRQTLEKSERGNK